MSETIASYWRFLLAGVLRRGQTGALVPSQRFLTTKMIAPVPRSYRGLLLELGPGTGALTLRLAARCPAAHILACEINPVLAEDLKRRVTSAGRTRQVEVIEAPAQEVLASLAKSGQQLGFILSGIPLGNLRRERVMDLLDGIAGALADGGMYIQFQYSLMDRKKIRSRFANLHTVPVWLNIPPAVVYYARKLPQPALSSYQLPLTRPVFFDHRHRA